MSFPYEPTYLNLEYFFNKLTELIGAFFYFITGSYSGELDGLRIFLFILSVGLMLVIFYSTIGMQKLRRHEHEHMEHAFAKALGDDYYGIQKVNRLEPVSHTIVSTLERPGQTPTQLRWRDIVTYANSANPSDWKVAIIDADNMLDELLTSLGYAGETLGDRLRNAARSFPTADKAGRAHGIRNRIAHDPHFKPEHDDILEAISLYEAVFREFNFI